MKNLGSHFEYEEDRNKDLLRAFYEQLSLGEHKTLWEVYDRTVKMPSARFWVSEERAAIIISRMFLGDKLKKMKPTKRAMYYEIFSRVKEARKKNPKETIFNLTFDVVNSQAPEFYLSPKSAKVIICKIKMEWYEKRKHKYRHLFM